LHSLHAVSLSCTEGVLSMIIGTLV
jgi:hypothetical protein